MRTHIIIAGGFALSAICLGIAKMIGGAGPSEMTSATVVFVILWLAAAAVNMRVGVYGADYSFREEIPIFLLIYLLPAGVAVLLKWKFF